MKMAMKPYSERSLGFYFVAGNQGQNYVQLRTVSRRGLSDITTKKGDYHTPNPHSYSAYRDRGLTGTILDYNGDYSTRRSGVQPYVFNWQIYDTGFDQNIYNEALEQLYEKLRGSVDLSVDLVQWRKMLQMANLYRRMVSGIANQAKKLVPQTEKIQKSLQLLDQMNPRSRRAKRLSREISSATMALAKARLEYVYGWAPTVKTVQDLAKGALRTDEPGLIKCEGRSRSTTTQLHEQYSIDSKIPLKMRATVSNRVSVVCYFNPRPGVIDNLSQISSLNPLSIAYEAMPYSFVLDWAVNMSGFLRTMESAFIHQNSFVMGYTTRVRRTTVDAWMTGWRRDSATAGAIFALSGIGVKTVFSRGGLSAAPYPTAPVIKLQLGASRALNALALARVSLPKADALIARIRR